ncbi:MAG: PDZ domain-containing protein, partial [Bacilli bacterium]
MKIKKQIKSFAQKIKRFFIKKGENDSNNKEAELTGFRLSEVIILVSIAAIIGAFSGSFLIYNFVTFNSNKENVPDEYVSEFEEAYQNVVDNYYEEVDKDALISAGINGMLSILDDYTSYMDAQTSAQFNERMNGVYEGIGIEFITSAGYVHTITTVFEDSPALAAGVKEGDIIMKVDDIDASTKTGTEISTYIKSENIDKVAVVVKRGNETITLDINKGSISIPSISKKTYEKNGKTVGYINISLFADNTSKQFNKALVA